jgi:hypothetical protein
MAFKTSCGDFATLRRLQPDSFADDRQTVAKSAIASA